MVWLAQKSGHSSLSLLFRHDDAKHEYVYDEGSEKLFKWLRNEAG